MTQPARPPSNCPACGALLDSVGECDYCGWERQPARLGCSGCLTWLVVLLLCWIVAAFLAGVVIYAVAWIMSEPTP